MRNGSVRFVIPNWARCRWKKISLSTPGTDAITWPTSPACARRWDGRKTASSYELRAASKHCPFYRDEACLVSAAIHGASRVSTVCVSCACSKLIARSSRLPLRQAGLPRQITQGLTHHRRKTLPQRVRTRLRPGCQFHLHAFMLEQGANAKYVIGIADRNAAVHAVRAHDVGHSRCRLRRIGALRLRDQSLLRNAAPQKIVSAYAALAEIRILPRPAGRDHHRRHPLLKQFVTVIQPRPVHRRRTSHILGSSENSDHIRFFRGCFGGGAHDARPGNAEK